MQKITPFLWYDGVAEVAMNFYLSVFSNSRVLNIMPGPDGKPSGVTFELEGMQFIAINGGPQFSFSPAISLFVHCETQGEVDELWEKLSEGGETQHCGWLTDKFGVSWQIIPEILGKLLNDPNPAKAYQVMQAMLAMDKIDIAGLKKAHEQG